MPAKSRSRDAAVIGWQTRAARRISDVRAAEAMVPWMYSRKHSPLRILSMPGQYWLWELGLRDSFLDLAMEFNGFESRRAVHSAMVRAALQHPGVFKPCEEPTDLVKWFAANRDSKFDIVSLDWIDSWSNDKENLLRAMFLNDHLAPDSMLVFTVGSILADRDIGNALREPEAHAFSLTFGSGGAPSGKGDDCVVEGTPGKVVRCASDCGYKARLISMSTFSQYEDRPRGLNSKVSCIFKIDQH